MVGRHYRDCCSVESNGKAVFSLSRASCFVWFLLSENARQVIFKRQEEAMIAFLLLKKGCACVRFVHVFNNGSNTVQIYKIFLAMSSNRDTFGCFGALLFDIN